MQLFSLIIKTGPAIFYDAAFRSVLEDHLPLLIENSDPKPIEVHPGIANKYLGDFSGLMQAAKILPEHWWIIMRMNGMINPTDYDGVTTTFVAPALDYLNRIVQLHRQRPQKTPLRT